jgi:hypothetical protein
MRYILSPKVISDLKCKNPMWREPQGNTAKRDPDNGKGFVRLWREEAYRFSEMWGKNISHKNYKSLQLYQAQSAFTGNLIPCDILPFQRVKDKDGPKSCLAA